MVTSRNILVSPPCNFRLSYGGSGGGSPPPVGSGSQRVERCGVVL